MKQTYVALRNCGIHPGQLYNILNSKKGGLVQMILLFKTGDFQVPC